MSLSQIGMTIVLVAYGGTWLVMAVVVWLYSERTAKLGIAADLRLLSLYALVHGLSDLVDVALRIPGVEAGPTEPLAAVRLTLLLASFVILLQFGLAISIDDKRIYRSIIAIGALAVVGLGSGLIALYAQGATASSVAVVERSSRLLVGLPASLLAAFGFYRLAGKCRRLNLHGCARDATAAAVAMATYGILAGGITTGYPIPTDIFGLPVQVYRMVAAVAITVSCVSLLRRFQVKQPQ